MRSSIDSSSIAVSTLAEPRFDRSPRLRHPPFDRADRGFQHCSDLFVLVITRSSEQQTVAQLRRQLVDPAADLLSQAKVAEHLFRRAVAARNVHVIVDLVR